MNAKELRTGNYVKIGEEHESYNCVGKTIKWELSNFYSLEKGYNNIEWFDSISLTEEWLLRFGFTPILCFDKPRTIKCLKQNFSIVSKNDYFDFRFNDFKLTQIKYVHQLQNLYFSLTGEELVVSDSVS